MKAVLCKEFGPIEKLSIEEVPAMHPDKDEVIIAVKACGLNFPDTLIIQGKYQFKPPLPFSPGGEISGVVKKIGTAVKHLNVGDRVMYGAVFGGFAQEVKAKAAAVFKIPSILNDITAASSMLTYGTSYHALIDRANIQKGETLLVLGAAGGVGTAAIQIAKNLDVTIIAAASTNEKLDFCKENGATHLINYSTENLKDRVKELTDGKGADVIYDPVGDTYAEPALRAIARNGRYLVVGFAGGTIPKIPLNLALLKECQIIGVFWGAFVQHEPSQNAQNLQTIVQWFAEGKLKTQIHGLYPLEDVKEAMYAMVNKEIKGKVVLIPE